MPNSMRRRTFTSTVFASLALNALGRPAHAQAYPDKPVRLIVPYPAGGGTDFFARTVSSKLSEQLGQTIIVDNRPGASTIIGAEAAAKSAPDGYTVIVADNSTLAVNPSLYKRLPYDPINDFAPVTLTARFAMLLVVSPSSSKATTVEQLVEEARKAPSAMNYASAGAGSPHHLTMELFQQRAGVRLNHIPYKGAAPAIQDVVGGQVPVMFVDLAAGGPMIKAGKLRALAVASLQRIAALPAVPTLAEQPGFAGFEAWAWQGFAVPAGRPRDVIARLNAEYAKASADPGVRQKLIDAGVETVTSTPEEMSRYIKSETVKWAEVIKLGDIKVE